MAQRATHSAGERVSIFGLAFAVLAIAVGGAFLVGWLIGKAFL